MEVSVRQDLGIKVTGLCKKVDWNLVNLKSVINTPLHTQAYTHRQQQQKLTTQNQTSNTKSLIQIFLNGTVTYFLANEIFKMEYI